MNIMGDLLTHLEADVKINLNLTKIKNKHISGLNSKCAFSFFEINPDNLYNSKKITLSFYCLFILGTYEFTYRKL